MSHLLGLAGSAARTSAASVAAVSSPPGRRRRQPVVSITQCCGVTIPLRLASPRVRPSRAVPADGLAAALIDPLPVLAAVGAALPSSLSPPFPEPSNALSLPTWAIHVSSVAEWVVAMTLVPRLARATRQPELDCLAWGMIPSLGSAMCACTWHLNYNAEELVWLVALQARKREREREGEAERRGCRDPAMPSGRASGPPRPTAGPTPTAGCPHPYRKRGPGVVGAGDSRAAPGATGARGREGRSGRVA